MLQYNFRNAHILAITPMRVEEFIPNLIKKAIFIVQNIAIFFFEFSSVFSVNESVTYRKSTNVFYTWLGGSPRNEMAATATDPPPLKFTLMILKYLLH